MTQFRIIWLSLGGNLQVIGSVNDFHAIKAQTQQGTRLKIIRILCEDLVEWCNRVCEMSLLEFSQSRLSWIGNLGFRAKDFL